jgi:hypothetical protein
VSKKKDKKNKGKKKAKGPKKALVHNGFYLCRGKKVIFGLSMHRGRITFSNYVEFPKGMLWKDARRKMDRMKITYEFKPGDEPPF